MRKPAFPSDEEERLKELVGFDILDSAAEQSFDDLTLLASQICETHISLISLIDHDRQWFKSKVGLDASETPRDISWCGHAILGDEIFEISDAELDERFKDNPLFTGEPNVRFYAGAPLKTKAGHNIGTLCVIDNKPKTLTEWQRSALQTIGRQVVLLIEARLKEKSLIIANSKLDAIVNNIPVLLSTYNKDGHIDWINRQWTKELGWTESEIKNQRIQDMFHIENGKANEAFQFLHKPDSKWHPLSMRRKDEKDIYTSWTSVELNEKASLGIGQNIHVKMLAETELNRMNQRLDDILECANVGSWDWWIKEDKVLFDKRWCETLGLDYEETPMDISTWETRVHPDDRIKAEDDIQRHLNGETDVYQNVQRMKHSSGNWIWVVETGKISERDSQNKPIRFTGTQLEITKQKIIEQELRNNEEKVLAIYEASNDAIMMLTDKGFFDCNKKTLEMFQLKSKKDFSKLQPSDLSPEFQPDGQLSSKKEQEEIKTAYEKGINRFEWTHQTIDGKPFPAEVLLSAFIYQSEKVLLATIRDISNRKRLEKNLEEQRKITQHQSKLASIGQLAAGVGHEINNPLAIIKGYLSSIESEIKQKLPEELKIQTMIHKIDVAADRISNIVKGLRTFSRSDAIQLGIFNFKDAIEETFQLLREIYQKEGVTLLLETEKDKNFHLYGNKGRMEQVIINLLANAKDATEGQPNRLITLKLKELNGKVILTVQDTGKGIPASVADRIFDPFFTTKDVNKGTGIGLAITSSIIKEHDGEISFTTEENVGTTFKIELPLTLQK